MTTQKTLNDFFTIKRKELPVQESILDLPNRTKIGKSKIKYLPKLIKLLHNKCKIIGGCTPQIITKFYSIFKDEEIIFLISFFKSDIPNTENYYKRLGEEL